MNSPSNVVFIGRNPPMSYVLAILTTFSNTDVGDIVLKERGRAITTVVDVAEISKRRLMKELIVGSIIIGSAD